MKVNNFDALTKEIQKRIDKSLNKEVFKAIQKVEQKEITETVYDVYEPEVYVDLPSRKRRRKQGGMEDIRNIQIKGGKAKDGVLEVVNETPPNPDARDGATTNKDLPYLIEHGESFSGRYHYDYPGHPYSSPRPFTENTRLELVQENQHLEALKLGLENNGLNVW